MNGSAVAEAPIWRRARLWVPVLIWSLVIYTFSTSIFSAESTNTFIDPMLRWMFPGIAGPSIQVAHVLIRKSAHFIEYAVLFWLLLRGPMMGRPYVALLLCMLYALSDEGHQALVVSRTASMYDVAIDSTGALFSRFVWAALSELGWPV